MEDAKMSKRDNHPVTFIDLFAGAGGLAEGFVCAGYTPIAHVEMDRDACNTLRTRAAFHYLKQQGKIAIYENYLRTKREGEDGRKLWRLVPPSVTGKVIEETIGEDTIERLFSSIDRLTGGRSLDVIIGGPPCQAYSLAGRSRLGKEIAAKDPRNDLYKYYVRFLEHYQPRMFVFENVPGIFTAKDGEPFDDLQNLVKKLGYAMHFKVQDASEYGVLQKRRRVIVVGWKADIYGLSYPELEKVPMNYGTYEALLADLPERKAGEGKLCEPVLYTKDLSEMPYLRETGIRGLLDFTTQHVARPHNRNDREIYLMVLKEFYEHHRNLAYNKLPADHQTHKNKECFLDRFSVVDPDGCSHTVVAHISKDGHRYIYPDPHPDVERVRSLTVREAARLQSFPDDFFFEGSRTSAFKQIGNAVPVLFAFKIAEAIKQQLQNSTCSCTKI